MMHVRDLGFCSYLLSIILFANPANASCTSEEIAQILYVSNGGEWTCRKQAEEIICSDEGRSRKFEFHQIDDSDIYVGRQLPAPSWGTPTYEVQLDESSCQLANGRAKYSEDGDWQQFSLGRAVVLGSDVSTLAPNELVVTNVSKRRISVPVLALLQDKEIAEQIAMVDPTAHFKSSNFSEDRCVREEMRLFDLRNPNDGGFLRPTWKTDVERKCRTEARERAPSCFNMFLQTQSQSVLQNSAPSLLKIAAFVRSFGVSTDELNRYADFRLGNLTDVAVAQYLAHNSDISEFVARFDADGTLLHVDGVDAEAFRRVLNEQRSDDVLSKLLLGLSGNLCNS